MEMFKINLGPLVFNGSLVLKGKEWNNPYEFYLKEEGFTDDDIVNIKKYHEFMSKKKKGIEYHNVLIPFTKEDTDGLVFIYNNILNKDVNIEKTTFKTSIGTSIILDKNNITEFYNWFCINRDKFMTTTYEDFCKGLKNGY